MKLKEVHIVYKIIVATATITAFIFFYHEQFFTQAEAEDYAKAAQIDTYDAIEANTDMFEVHLQIYENDKKQVARNDIAKSIQTTQDAQSILRVMVSFHETNALTEQTETTLGNRLTRQQGVERCMMRGGDNCVADSP